MSLLSSEEAVEPSSAIAPSRPLHSQSEVGGRTPLVPIVLSRPQIFSVWVLVRHTQIALSEDKMPPTKSAHADGFGRFIAQRPARGAPTLVRPLSLACPEVECVRVLLR